MKLIHPDGVWFVHPVAKEPYNKNLYPPCVYLKVAAIKIGLVYRRFVAVDDDKDLEDVMARKRLPSLLGPKDFLDWVKATYKDI